MMMNWWWWFSHRLLSWIPSHLCSSWTLPLHSLASDEESFHNWRQMLQIWQLWQKTKVESPGKKNLVPRQILLGLPSLRASSSHLWQINFISTHKNYFHLRTIFTIVVTIVIIIIIIMVVMMVKITFGRGFSPSTKERLSSIFLITGRTGLKSLPFFILVIVIVITIILIVKSFYDIELEKVWH